MPRAAGEVARAGERILEDLDAALQMLLFGRADAAVIAPVAMEAVQAAGFHYPDLGTLIAEWLRLDSTVQLAQVKDAPLVRLAAGAPRPIVVATPEENTLLDQLFLSLKESMRIATALVVAKV